MKMITCEDEVPEDSLSTYFSDGRIRTGKVYKVKCICGECLKG